MPREPIGKVKSSVTRDAHDKPKQKIKPPARDAHDKPKPQSESVQAAREQAAGIKASQKINEDAYKKSLPSLTSNFKGVGVTPYLDKNGNVSTINTGTNIKSSAGTSGNGNTGAGNSSVSGDTFEEKNPSMLPTPTPVVVETPKAAEPKTPTRDVTNISSLVPQFNAEHITKILFESLSAVELSIVERHDTIEGINQRYSIISNLSEIRKKYDIAKQLTVMDKFKPLTRIFTINLEDKIPQEDYIALEDLTATYQYLDENNQIVNREKGYYYIDTNGDLVIELINIERNQQVEVEIDTNGTIYKVES